MELSALLLLEVCNFHESYPKLKEDKIHKWLCNVHHHNDVLKPSVHQIMNGYDLTFQSARKNVPVRELNSATQTSRISSIIRQELIGEHETNNSLTTISGSTTWYFLHRPANLMIRPFERKCNIHGHVLKILIYYHRSC